MWSSMKITLNSCNQINDKWYYWEGALPQTISGLTIFFNHSKFHLFSNMTHILLWKIWLHGYLLRKRLLKIRGCSKRSVSVLLSTHEDLVSFYWLLTWVRNYPKNLTQKFLDPNNVLAILKPGDFNSTMRFKWTKTPSP